MDGEHNGEYRYGHRDGSKSPTNTGCAILVTETLRSIEASHPVALHHHLRKQKRNRLQQADMRYGEVTANTLSLHFLL